MKKKSESISSCILAFSHAVIAVENEMALNDALFLKAGGSFHLLPLYCSEEWFIYFKVLFSSFQNYASTKKR